MGKRSIRSAALLGAGLLMVLLGGCASYSFDVHPNSPSGSKPVEHLRVTGVQETPLEFAPLRYSLQPQEGHLIVFIENPTSTPVELLSPESTVTDPKGINHELLHEVIGPGLRVREIFPPVPPPQTDQEGPPPSSPSPFASNDQPGYIEPSGFGRPSAGPSPQVEKDLYWQWNGESSILLDLHFKQGDHAFVQQLVIHRVKE